MAFNGCVSEYRGTRPLNIRTKPDITPLRTELARVVRMGQTNIDFARIWELRKNRQVTTEPIADLENNVAERLESLEETIRARKRR